MDVLAGGRPNRPERLLRALRLQVFYSVRSEGLSGATQLQTCVPLFVGWDRRRGVSHGCSAEPRPAVEPGSARSFRHVKSSGGVDVGRALHRGWTFDRAWRAEELSSQDKGVGSGEIFTASRAATNARLATDRKRGL